MRKKREERKVRKDKPAVYDPLIRNPGCALRTQRPTVKSAPGRARVRGISEKFMYEIVQSKAYLSSA